MEATGEPVLLHLAPGVDYLSTGGTLLLRNDVRVLRVQGSTAALLRDTVLPAVSQGTTREGLVASTPDGSRQDVLRLVDLLGEAGLIVEHEASGAGAAQPWTLLVTSSPAERRAIASRAAAARAVIVGLGPHQLTLAETLAQAGVGHIVVVDAGGPGELLGVPAAPRVPSPESLTSFLRPRWPETRFEAVEEPISRDTTAGIVAGSDLVVVSMDHPLSACHHWVNRATFDAGIPSLHAAVWGNRADLGPLVIPGVGPCYMCWRMRALACEDDFESAMMWEEHFDGSRSQANEVRPTLPHMFPWIAGVLAHEALASLLGVVEPRLVGGVLALDGRSLTERAHRVAIRPDCPTCRGPEPSNRAPPPRRGELVTEPDRQFPLERVIDAVVSSRCGIVRSMDRFDQLPQDPEQPFVVQTLLANTLFDVGPSSPPMSCAGRGSTIAAAMAGAVAESLERHAALTWIPRRRVSAIRSQLDGASLDPRDLVLYAPHQYGELPYARYEESTPLDWVVARSLRTGDDVWVPLIATHLNYQAPQGAGYLFRTTSSGFAAGSTLAQAVLHALLEVVERDAFVLSWAHRWPGRRSLAADVPDAKTRMVAAAYARRHVRIDVHRLPSDSSAVVLAAMWSSAPPAVVIGLGAHRDPVLSARHAVFEAAQVRVSLHARLSRPETAAHIAQLAADQNRVLQMHEHTLLYADPATAEAGLAHLLDAPVERWDASPHEPTAVGVQLDELVERLLAVAQDVLYVDVTPDDVAALGVHVARAIVPGFQPIHVGARETRLGGTRLHVAPHLFGIGPAVLNDDDLNLSPHPLG